MDHPNQIRILKETPGTGPEVKKGTLVICEFSGTLEDGTLFDSSKSHGRAYECVVGSKKVIAGWSLGLIGMRQGGRRTFFVPAELAYGARAVGAYIKPNSNLIYEVEILEARNRED